MCVEKLRRPGYEASTSAYEASTSAYEASTSAYAWAGRGCSVCNMYWSSGLLFRLVIEVYNAGKQGNPGKLGKQGNRGNIGMQDNRGNSCMRGNRGIQSITMLVCKVMLVYHVIDV